ncbi:MAG TPA: hypothetical protein VGC34_00760, partial [Steroidobacteraceae bacterium]
MTAKSVLAVEVDSSAFDKFQKAFQKHLEQVKQGGELWKVSNKGSAEALANTQKLMTSAQQQNILAVATSGAVGNQAKSVATLERSWHNIAGFTKNTSSNILAATKSLLSWTGALSAVTGLLGAGGLFGIDRLASNVAGQRRNAVGLGMRPGEYKAFNVDFSRLTDTDSYLDWVNGMETDVSKQGPAYSLLHRGLSGDTKADSFALLRSERELALKTPMNLLGPTFSAYGLQDDP